MGWLYDWAVEVGFIVELPDKIKLGHTLYGDDARRFREEMERIENLGYSDPEYWERIKFFRECKDKAKLAVDSEDE